MVHSLEDGSHLAFLDFDDVQRIENIDIDIPDALTRLLDDTFVDHNHFPFRCGFLGYELLAAHFGVRCKALRDLNFPAALLARPSTQIQIFDKNLITTSFHSRRALELKNLASKRLTSPNAEIRNLKPNLSTEEYEKIFRSAKENILDGNTYQIKISIRYSGVGTIPPIISYGNLLETNPAPEAFVLKWDDFSLVSGSPETILKKTGNRLVTRPIGGTTPRDASWAADRLKFDPKENAEHNMLIDLERNDLSRVCEPGSVHIEKLREVETYAHLHHLVSTISGKVREGITTSKIVASMLPGGTITGCPKHRTMELIDELEPCYRGPYTGSFGVVHDSGDLNFNLIIRTLCQMDGACHVQAGGGIVVDSEPGYEYKENQIKAQALLDLLEKRR